MNKATYKNVEYGLKILEILTFKGKHTKAELAELLDIDDERVKRIVNSLRQIDAIDIIGNKGPKGGYELRLNALWKEFSIDDRELEAIELAYKFLKKERGFYLRNQYEILLNKIRDRVKNNQKCVDVNVVKRFNYNMDFKGSKKEEEIINRIEKARTNYTKLEMQYYSLNSNQTSNRIIHPYNLYYYNENGDYYLIAYCQNRQSIRDFKVKRIKGIKELEDTFEILDYDYETYTQGHMGIHRGGIFDLKLIVKYPFTVYFKENPVIQNQTITELTQDKMILEAEVKGGQEIVSWLLSIGNYVEVIEPQELRETIIKELQNSLLVYQNKENSNEILRT